MQILWILNDREYEHLIGLPIIFLELLREKPLKHSNLQYFLKIKQKTLKCKFNNFASQRLVFEEKN